MSDLADLYPGFEAHWIDTSAGRLFARSGGSGPPLLMLHGYPQSNVIWHKVAPTLAKQFRVVVADLPGYGWSAAPRSGPDHVPYTKRAMANAMIDLMEALGHARFSLAGHDRGARVGYRLALDHPGRLERLAVLDIVPIYTMWHQMDRILAYKVWHWTYLALPEPFPETMIGKDPLYYFDWKLASWSGTKDLTPFDPRALAHYRAAFQDPLRIHATCEDYRAGRTTDLAADEADRAAGKKIACPVLVLWGSKGIPSENGPLTAWRDWADDVRGQPLDCGHFPAEERPAETAAALLAFFTGSA
ncbi:alpha/beta fold hydrolase [Rhodoplanes serenus]|uniref:alpha/beta fold hydrolase n=1 Tax=Rhodoplanes serenus TaxID=200615 RepID=UPI000DABE2A2|nr:alpha/beta hydrolase [Rhodoplanes serenus]RAI32954.1 alpha/beta hydrolase [Rhodoplanes serenus]